MFDGLLGMLSVTPTVVTTASARGAVVINATIVSPLDRFSPWPPNPEKEGFTLAHDSDTGNLVVQGESGVGALYGTFRLLHLIRTEVRIKSAFCHQVNKWMM